MYRCVAFILAVICSACASLPNKQTAEIGRVNYHYAMQGKGSPPVILEGGLGSTMDDWHAVFGELGKLTTVFAYNRLGYDGTEPVDKSENSANNVSTTVLDALIPGAGAAIELASAGVEKELPVRDGLTVVNELRRLLAGIEVQPPYILVGHSLGGTYMELYARSYPQEVFALVLVDTRPAQFTELCRKELPEERCDIPDWLRNMLPDFLEAELRGAEETARQIQAAGPLPSVPVVVLINNNPDAFKTSDGREMWKRLQKQLAENAPNGEYVGVENTGHFVQKDQPEVVVDVISRLLSSAPLVKP